MIRGMTARARKRSFLNKLRRFNGQSSDRMCFVRCLFDMPMSLIGEGKYPIDIREKENYIIYRHMNMQSMLFDK